MSPKFTALLILCVVCSRITIAAEFHGEAFEEWLEILEERVIAEYFGLEKQGKTSRILVKTRLNNFKIRGKILDIDKVFRSMNGDCNISEDDSGYKHVTCSRKVSKGDISDINLHLYLDFKKVGQHLILTENGIILGKAK